MPTPTWNDYLPLATPADVRERLSTPEAALNASAAPDISIGLTVAGNVLTTGIPHGMTDWTAVQIASTGTLPAPLLPNVIYYVRDTTAVAFSVASVIGGSAIPLTTVGSGQVSVRNWALNDVLAAKITKGDQHIYDRLLLLVADHLMPMTNARWYGYFPIQSYGELVAVTPIERARVVLNNLTNSEVLNWASVDTCIWLLTEDGASRNQIEQATDHDRYVTTETRKKKLAEESILCKARLLTVGTAAGTCGIFNFDMTTASVQTCLL